MKEGLAPFQALVRERCGLLLEGSAEATLARALATRLEALSLEGAAYYRHLCGSEDEFRTLVELLTINETYFFREPAQIGLLVDRLVPRLLATPRVGQRLRILSAGCSSGEEPYSLAMALLDRYGEEVSRLFDLRGADIDGAALEKAREARYTEYSFRGVPAGVRARYFTRHGSEEALDEKVRRLVRFHEVNLLSGAVPQKIGRFEVVFYRNVSIYFDPPTRRLMLENLASLLEDDGVLVVGAAETLPNDLGVLSLVSEEGHFYFVRPDPSQAEDAGKSLPPVAPAPPAPDRVEARAPTRDGRDDEEPRRLETAPALDPENAETRLRKAHALFERQDFVGAEALASSVLAEEPWSIDALLLLGLAAKAQRRAAEAIRWLKQATYTQCGCWPAHFFLAELYREQAETGLARRAYGVVLRLLSVPGHETGLRYVPLDLPESEVRFLCEHQLARLPGPPALAGRT